MNIDIRQAGPDEAETIAALVGELLGEIMASIGIQAFDFRLDEATGLLRSALTRGKCFVLVACTETGDIAGFATLYECFALYAQGSFGTLSEFYVRPAFRSQGIGHLIAEAARAFGTGRGWKRLEVTTPPLPQFERTLGFYEREGFAVTGGRKLKLPL